MPTMAEIKAAGRARVRRQRQAAAAEEASQALADELWSSTFDHVFDTTDDNLPDLAACAATVLVVLPGFSSWHALTQAHVDEYRTIRCANRAAVWCGAGVTTVAVRWPCGTVVWSGEDATTEAGAAWQSAHEATPAASTALSTLLTHLASDDGARRRNVVVVAHSLGARVALGSVVASSSSSSSPQLLLLGPAVDCDALSPGQEFVDVVTTASVKVVVVRSSRDETLQLYGAVEYARCGRKAPEALGSVGCDDVTVLDVSDQVDGHSPFDYLKVEAVREALEEMLMLS